MEQSLLVSRINDAVRLSDTSATPKFVGFLRPEEVADILSSVKLQGCRYSFFGGFPDAERVYFGAFPDWCEPEDGYFPISALTFKFRESDTLSHRHFLGTFMSLGITRETVGDILIEKGRAVAFFSSDIVNFVKTQITKISGAGVTVTEGFSEPLPGHTGFSELSDTVASARLDCVVAALIGGSRSKAAELIEQKLVLLNSVCCDKTVKTVKNGDTVTVRSRGKFIIDSIDGKTKKDRLILKAKKYI